MSNFNDVLEQLTGDFTFTKAPYVYPANDLLLVKTPYLYPDNDVIDIFIKEEENGLLLTDLGETIGWLISNAISDPLNDQFIADTLKIQNIQRDRGFLIKRVDGQTVPILFTAINELSRAIIHLTTYYPF